MIRTRVRPVLVPLLTVAAFALAGCGDPEATPTTEETAVQEPSPSDPPSTPSESPSPSITPGTGSVDVDTSVADLAERLDIDEDEVEVVAVEEVTWRDGSRGCATPGDMYTQALIDGSRITLRVDGTDYEYHAGGSRPPALCEKPTE